MPEETYTVSEVAARMKVSVDTVRRWITSRQLHATDVSAKRGSKKPRYSIEADDLAAFRLRRAVGAPLPTTTRRRPSLAGVIEFF